MVATAKRYPRPRAIGFASSSSLGLISHVLPMSPTRDNKTNPANTCTK